MSANALDAEILGHAIQLDPRAPCFGQSWLLDRYRVRCPRLVQWVFKRALKASSAPVVLDVGAHTGQFSLMAAAWEGMTVHAFEPVPDFYDVLRANVVLNGLEGQVFAHALALGNKAGLQVIHVPDDPHFAGLATMSQDAPAAHGPWHEVEVAVDTLDNFCLKEKVVPHAIKIDVEGFEKFVLEGGKQTITTHHPAILAEHLNVHTERFGYHVNAMTAILKTWDYVCVVRGNDVFAVHGEPRKVLAKEIGALHG